MKRSANLNMPAFIKYLSALLLFGLNGIVAGHISLNSYEIVFFNCLHAILPRCNAKPYSSKSLGIRFKPKIFHSYGHIDLGKIRQVTVFPIYRNDYCRCICRRSGIGVFHFNISSSFATASSYPVNTIPAKPSFSALITFSSVSSINTLSSAFRSYLLNNVL